MSAEIVYAVVKTAAETVATDGVKRLLKEGLQWISKKRHERFIEQLCREIQIELDGKWKLASVDDAFRKLSESEDAQEAIYEAAKLVGLGSSTKIGPRVVAMILQPMLAEERDAHIDERKMFDACQTMTDEDFFKATKDIGSFLDEGRVDGHLEGIDRRALLAKDRYLDVLVAIDEVNDRGGRLSRAPMNFSARYGRWAKCMADAGLLLDESREEVRAPLRHNEWEEDASGTTRTVTQTMRVTQAAVTLCEYAERAATEHSAAI